jgi:tetratricopeptide (TPR) repeat protein
MILSKRNQQLLLVAGALVLTVVLYLAPKKIEKADVVSPVRAGYSFDDALNRAKQQLKREELEQISSLEKQIDGNKGNTLLLDSLGKRWDALQMPAISAHYYEEAAEREPGEKSWADAANRYFDAFHSTDDSIVRTVLVQKAIACYEKALQINPKNLDIKTDLGISYVEGTNEPMKGIMALREVVAENPQHENAQFNLGLLSMKSGQFSKAVERFEKVLSINPERKETYLMLGKAWMALGNKEKALENLERLKKETTNPDLSGEANNLINQITNH